MQDLLYESADVTVLLCVVEWTELDGESLVTFWYLCSAVTLVGVGFEDSSSTFTLSEDNTSHFYSISLGN